MTGCSWIASKRGWSLLHGNVMVEGTSDVAYFKIASRVYELAHGKRLLGVDFSMFAAGLGDEGGTFGISERFPTLFEMASLDVDSNDKRRYRVIALVDDDKMGQAAVAGITRGHRQIIEYKTIFKLRRAMPLKAGSPKSLAEKTKTANDNYGTLECTIEDLLDTKFIEKFIQGMPQAIYKPASVAASGVHRYWTEDGKRKLLQFTEKNATLEDMKNLVEVLKSLRSYVELPSDGV